MWYASKIRVLPLQHVKFFSWTNKLTCERSDSETRQPNGAKHELTALSTHQQPPHFLRTYIYQSSTVLDIDKDENEC